MSDSVLAENVATALRRRILRGQLPPGTPIKERDNALDMGVSRTPMREAVRMLAKEGLVELRPSRSPIVARPDGQVVKDQAEVLIALEKLSVELACLHATAEDIARIEELVAYMAEHYDSMDPLDMFEIDMTFHSALAEASHNASLAATHRQYLQRLWRSRFISASKRRNRNKMVHDHTTIVDAVKSGDPVASRAAIDQHLGHLAEDMQEILEPNTPQGK